MHFVQFDNYTDENAVDYIFHIAFASSMEGILYGYNFTDCTA